MNELSFIYVRKYHPKKIKSNKFGILIKFEYFFDSTLILGAPCFLDTFSNPLSTIIALQFTKRVDKESSMSMKEDQKGKENGFEI